MKIFIVYAGTPEDWMTENVAGLLLACGECIATKMLVSKAINGRYVELASIIASLCLVSDIFMISVKLQNNETVRQVQSNFFWHGKTEVSDTYSCWKTLGQNKKERSSKNKITNLNVIMKWHMTGMTTDLTENTSDCTQYGVV